MKTPTEEELNEARRIIMSYRIIDDRLAEISEELRKLENEKNELLAKLDTCTDDETALIEKIKARYKKDGEEFDFALFCDAVMENYLKL